MDEIALMFELCKKADINPEEGIYVIRGEALLLPILKSRGQIKPKVLKALYEQAKSAFINEIMLNASREVLDAGVDAAIELAEECIREATQHPEETA